MAIEQQLTNAEKAYIAIKEKLLAGEFNSGPFLSERSLVKHLGVGRTGVRDALQRLHGEGLIQSRGSFKTKTAMYIEDLNPADMIAHFEIREMIETQSARLAALNMNAYQVRRLKALYERIGSAGESEEATHAAARKFHEYLVANCGNPILDKIWRDHHVMDPMWRSPAHVRKLVARQTAITGRRWDAVLDAIQARNAPEAGRLMFDECHALTEAVREILWELEEEQGENAGLLDAIIREGGEW